MRPRAFALRGIAGALLPGLAVLAAGCGSSKPAFCDNFTALQKSVTGINVTGGIRGVRSQLTSIQSQSKSLVSSAKSDFPDESSAISRSVSTLETSVRAISSSPTPSQLVSVASDVKNVVSSLSAFHSATKSKCQ
jgi:hypothetical protein